MSSRPAGGSALDRLQALGESPTVNPTREPTAPTPIGGPAWLWALGGLVGTLALIGYWIVAPESALSFIYQAF